MVGMGGGNGGNQGATNAMMMQQQSSNDFNLEFLDQLPVDGNNFSAQDLLMSLENETFNLQDMLQ